MAAPADPEPTPLIDVASLRARLGEPGLRLLDARFDLADPEAGLRAFLAGYLPGARYVHLERELSGHGRPASEGRHPLPAPDAFAATLARLGITPATPVVVYDAAGGALAAARGRNYVTPDDIKAIAAPVFGHRMALTSEAELRGARLDTVLADIVDQVPVPRGRET